MNSSPVKARELWMGAALLLEAKTLNPNTSTLSCAPQVFLNKGLSVP